MSSRTIQYANYQPLHNALASGDILRLSAVPDEIFRVEMNLSENRGDWFAIPLISRGITMGLLSVYKIDRVFSKTEVEILESFSYQVTSALDNSRVYADLQKSYQQLQLAQEKMVHAARLSAIGEMAAGVAHQINNPLMTIIADSHLLLKHVEPDSSIQESAEAISRAAHKAGDIVQRLLDFARTSPTKMSKININKSLQEAIDLMRPQIKPVSATLDIDFSADMPPIAGSEEHLHDIWINLLLNARDAIKDVEAGLIQISTTYNKKDDMINIVVKDNGVGIDAESLENIFNPFYTTKERGTGLGLSICVDIVRQHQGTIDVESVPKQGTRFIVRLPIAK